MMKKTDNFISKLSTFNKMPALFIFCIIVTFVLVYILNRLYPIAFDDWLYTFVFGETKRVDSIGDVFRSQYNHYFTWGGRSVVHVIAQLLLMLPPLLHDFLNSVVLVSLLFVFYRMANYGNQTNVFVFIVIAMFMWFIQPAFAFVYFWITGSANYLWSMLIIILFLYPYYIYYRNGTDKKGNIVLAMAFLLVGIFAGWTNENMPFGISAFIIYFCYLLKIEKRNIPYWAIFGFVGMLIGAAIMLKAPGNYIRLQGDVASTGVDVSEGVITLNYLVGNIPNMLFLYFKRLLLPVLIPYAIIFYFFYKQRNSIANYNTIKHTSFMFLLAGHFAFAAMIGSLNIPTRSLFGIICFLFLALFILIANMPIKKPIVRRILLGIMTLVIVFFGFDYYFSKCQSYFIVNKIYDDRKQQIEMGKKDGQKDFVFDNKMPPIRGKVFYGDGDDASNPNYFLNVWCAQYHGVNSVRVSGLDEKQEQQQDNN